MKAQCPAQCGRELGNGAFIVCTTCFAEVPQSMKSEISRLALVVRQTRNPVLLSKYMRIQRQAKERAIQFVIDKHNKQKVSA